MVWEGIGDNEPIAEVEEKDSHGPVLSVPK
jgi:hypothetical protein